MLVYEHVSLLQFAMDGYYEDDYFNGHQLDLSSNIKVKKRLEFVDDANTRPSNKHELCCSLNEDKSQKNKTLDQGELNEYGLRSSSPISDENNNNNVTINSKIQPRVEILEFSKSWLCPQPNSVVVIKENNLPQQSRCFEIKKKLDDAHRH